MPSMTTTDDEAETWTITIRGARAAAFRALADQRNHHLPDAFGPLGHMPNLAVDVFEEGLLALAEREAPDAAATLTLMRTIEREERDAPEAARQLMREIMARPPG